MNVVALTVDAVTFSENVATIFMPTATPVALLFGDIVPIIGPVMSGTGVDVGIGVGEAMGSPLINNAWPARHLLEHVLYLDGGVFLADSTVYRSLVGIGNQRVVKMVFVGMAENLQTPGLTGFGVLH